MALTVNEEKELKELAVQLKNVSTTLVQLQDREVEKVEHANKDDYSLPIALGSVVRDLATVVDEINDFLAHYASR